MDLQARLVDLGIDLTEEEFIGAVKRVSSLYARDFTFGIYSEEDIIQECYVITLKELHRFDKNKAIGLTTIDKVERFLYVMLLNRIKNLKRDKFCKTNSPCKDCYDGEPCTGTHNYCQKFLDWKSSNDSKMSVMNPWSLNSENDDCEREQHSILPCTKSEGLFNGVDLNDFITVISPKLNKDMQLSLDALRKGEKIGHAKRAALLEQIHEILGEDNG